MDSWVELGLWFGCVQLGMIGLIVDQLRYLLCQLTGKLPLYSKPSLSGIAKCSILHPILLQRLVKSFIILTCVHMALYNTVLQSRLLSQDVTGPNSVALFHRQIWFNGTSNLETTRATSGQHTAWQPQMIKHIEIDKQIHKLFNRRDHYLKRK